MTCDEVRVASSGLCRLLRGGYGIRLVDSDQHREIGEALVFPVRSDHVVDP